MLACTAGFETASCTVAARCPCFVVMRSGVYLQGFVLPACTPFLLFVLRVTGSFCSWLTTFLPGLQVDFDTASSAAAVVAAAAVARLHFVIAC